MVESTMWTTPPKRQHGRDLDHSQLGKYSGIQNYKSPVIIIYLRNYSNYFNKSDSNDDGDGDDNLICTFWIVM